MNSSFSLNKLSVYQYVKTGFYLFSFLSLATFFIYVVVHVFLFQNAAFQFDEVAALLKMIGIELFITVCLIAVLFFTEKIDLKRSTQRLKQVEPKRLIMTLSIFFLLTAGNAQSVSGSKRDAATGMMTSFQTLSMSRVKIIMNGEVLGHTQIPLGEKFTIINEGVTGFFKKSGKVSIGCSLKITDSKGKVLIQMPDLFAAKDIFTIEESKFLKCIISTGKPMKWDQKYEVTTMFWDKWGDGKITNKVVIETIDVP